MSMSGWVLTAVKCEIFMADKYAFGFLLRMETVDHSRFYWK
jgi:hypothetical protein